MRKELADRDFLFAGSWSIMSNQLLHRLEELNNDAIFRMSEAIMKDDENALLLWNRIHLFASHYILDVKGTEYQQMMVEQMREDGYITLDRNESPVGDDNIESVN